MSFLNKTVEYLVEKLFNNNTNLLLSCKSANTSNLLKDVNILIFDSFKSNLNDQPEIKSEPSSIRSDYDYDEALVYLIFILFWYSLAIVALICTQTKKSELQYLEDSQNATKYLLRGTKSEHVKREVLELLKGPGYMQKMNEIYFENPNHYKIKRFELKRIKQIDKKLKQYYSNNQNDYYKTFDASQLDDKNKHKTKMEANLFLLKDLQKLDNNNNNNAINQLNLNKQHSDPSHSAHQSFHSSPSSPILTNRLSTNETIRNNRFKVEKINEIV